jgi:hypothetical protein
MWLGRMNRLSISDTASAQPTITGITPSMSPMVPSINASGRNAQIVVITVATTGHATCRVPVTAACSAARPSRASR